MEETVEIKLCKDCKYNYGERCTNSKLMRLDLVNGDHQMAFCEIEREWEDSTPVKHHLDETYCGKDAKYFEAKDE